MEVILIMFFLLLSNADVNFVNLEKLIWRSYNIAEVLSITSKIELIDKKEFAKKALNKNSETFIIYISTLKILTTMSIYPFKAF